MDDDGVNEVLLVPKRKYARPLLYAQELGLWREQARLEGFGSPWQLIDLIREGNLKLVKPRYKALEIDGVEWLLQPHPPGPR
jgi:hypothetical protein